MNGWLRDSSGKVAIGAPRRTLNRREAAGQLLSSEEADKAVRVARVTARAQQVFAGQPAYAVAWLRELDESHLPTDWSRRVSVTRAWGDRWLREAHAAVLMVRSVLLPETYNLVINPRHADATRIRRLTSFPYPLDSRLL